jgi:hypothetical protein
MPALRGPTTLESTEPGDDRRQAEQGIDDRQNPRPVKR